MSKQETYPGHDGDKDGEDTPPLPGFGTKPVADPLGPKPRLLGPWLLAHVVLPLFIAALIAFNLLLNFA
jgi:hypothetical protein